MSVLLLIFAIQLSKPASANWFGSEQCIAQKNNQEILEDFSRNIVKEIEVSELKKNPNQYCNDRMFYRSLRANNFSNKDALDLLGRNDREKVFEELEKADKLKDLSRYKNQGFPWVRSLFPSKRVRMEVAKDRAGSSNGLQGASAAEALEYLSNDLCKPGQDANKRYISSDLKEMPDMKLDIKMVSKLAGNKHGKGDTYEKISIGSNERAGCAEILGVLHYSDCDEASLTIKRISLSASSINLSMIKTGAEIFDNVLNDARYQDGLRRAAIKILKKVNADTAEGDLFSDIKSSFIESGRTPTEAEEMTWNTIGLISTAGASLVRRFEKLGDTQSSYVSKIALSSISRAIPYLDHISSEKGQTYSFPPSVKAGCNTSKSYHFWYAAYLARRAALESKNPAASAAMAFQAQKAYQLLVRDENNERKNTQPENDPWLFDSNDAIKRADLAYAANGAVFGANQAGNRPVKLNVDKTINSLIEDAGRGEDGILASLAGQISDSQMVKNYSIWNHRFNPNDAFYATESAGYPSTVDTSYLEVEKGATLELPCLKNN